MAVGTACQTPGITYTTHIAPGAIDIALRGAIPGLDADTATLLEANVHNALELALAPLCRPVASGEKHETPASGRIRPGHEAA